MEEQILICKNCNTKSNSKFCPNCGQRIIKQLSKTVDEIEYMNKLIETTAKVMGEEGEKPVILMLQIIIIKTTLDWCSGESDVTPVEVLVAGGKSSNEKITTLIETAKLGLAKKE